MIGLCSKCGVVAELYDGVCSICKFEMGIQPAKNAESVVKTALDKLVGGRKSSSLVVKEDTE